MKLFSTETQNSYLCISLPFTKCTTFHPFYVLIITHKMEVFSMTLLMIDQNSEINLTDWKLDALQAFKIKMTDKEKLFPCIPATQAFALHQLRYGVCDDPREESTAQTFP